MPLRPDIEPLGKPIAFYSPSGLLSLQTPECENKHGTFRVIFFLSFLHSVLVFLLACLCANWEMKNYHMYAFIAHLYTPMGVEDL